MTIGSRVLLYKQIEAMRKRPLLVYVTNERVGIPSQIAADVLPEIMDQLEALPEKTDALDLLVVSNGGDPTVAFRIMTLIRERAKKVSVLVPQAAYSAATLLAMGADEIIMHPNGNLGPVDPQIRIQTGDGPANFASEDVSAFLKFVREDVGLTDQEHLGSVFQTLCNQIGSVPLGFSARASQLSVSLGEKLLRMHMVTESDFERAKVIAESLCKDFFDHGYAVGRKEAKTLGLKVADPEPALTDLMWKIWTDFESELEVRKRFSPIRELMQSSQGPKLTCPVPQVTAPPSTPPAMVQAALQAAVQTEVIEPVDVRVVIAAVESLRLASCNVDLLKIFAFRAPDLKIEYNCVSTWNGWEAISVPAA